MQNWEDCLEGRALSCPGALGSQAKMSHGRDCPILSPFLLTSVLSRSRGYKGECKFSDKKHVETERTFHCTPKLPLRILDGELTTCCKTAGLGNAFPVFFVAKM